MKRLVLVVEDEVDSLEMLQALLEEEGYDVIGASDGRAALERLATLRPHLIITDVMMPYMSGTELITWIQQRPELRATPILVMSAGRGEEVASRFGCAYVKKPFDLAAFFALIAALVGRSSATA